MDVLLGEVAEAEQEGAGLVAHLHGRVLHEGQPRAALLRGPLHVLDEGVLLHRRPASLPPAVARVGRLGGAAIPEPRHLRGVVLAAPEARVEEIVAGHQGVVAWHVPRLPVRGVDVHVPHGVQPQDHVLPDVVEVDNDVFLPRRLPPAPLDSGIPEELLDALLGGLRVAVVLAEAAGLQQEGNAVVGPEGAQESAQHGVLVLAGLPLADVVEEQAPTLPRGSSLVLRRAEEQGASVRHGMGNDVNLRLGQTSIDERCLVASAGHPHLTEEAAQIDHRRGEAVGLERGQQDLVPLHGADVGGGGQAVAVREEDVTEQALLGEDVVDRGEQTAERGDQGAIEVVDGGAPEPHRLLLAQGLLVEGAAQLGPDLMVHMVPGFRRGRGDVGGHPGGPERADHAATDLIEGGRSVLPRSCPGHAVGVGVRVRCGRGAQGHPDDAVVLRGEVSGGELGNVSAHGRPPTTLRSSRHM